MKLLVIGGTKFLGRHIVEAACARGHELTLFHRGRTNPGLFDVEEILGDRDGEVDRLGGRKWDAVIDTCGYFPRVVEQSAEQLSDQVDLYCFISTISVYADPVDRSHPSLTESSELLRFLEPPTREEITGESYGRFKVLCEEAVAGILGNPRTLIVRPGLIVGPHDPTDRFTYWVDRFSRKDQVLIPNRAQQVIQVIDARDLAAFVVKLLERGSGDVVNAAGPAEEIMLGDLWSECQTTCGGRARTVTVDDDFLARHEVKEWQDLPLVLPKGDPFPAVSLTRAQTAGLALRPLAETITDTAKWHSERGEVELKAGMSRSREEELLAAFHDSR